MVSWRNSRFLLEVTFRRVAPETSASVWSGPLSRMDSLLLKIILHMILLFLVPHFPLSLPSVFCDSDSNGEEFQIWQKWFFFLFFVSIFQGQNRILMVVGHLGFVLKFNICFYFDGFLHETVVIKSGFCSKFGNFFL